MHYIAIFVIYCNDAIVNAIKIAYETVEGDNAEETIEALFTKALIGGGLIGDAAMIIYIGIVFQTIFYLIAYINRMLKVGFLLVISPLITVTYSIDKMGDGKAQALDTWLKEYIYTILIQPFHCIIYFSFISVAFKLVNEGGFDYSFNQLSAGVLAILCIKFINDGEKIVRKIFGFQDDNSKTSMMAGAMMAVATVKSASNAISKTKTGFNKTAAFAGKFKKDLMKDTGLGKRLEASKGKRQEHALEKEMDKHGGGYARKANESDAEYEARRKGAQDSINARKQKRQDARDKITGVRNSVQNFRRNTKAGRIADFAARKTLSTSAAIMAFAATYATGDTDALSAIGYGAAAGRGMDKAFDSSAERNDADAAQSYAEASEAKREELEQNKEILEDNIKKHEEAIDNFDEVEEKFKEMEELNKEHEEPNKQDKDKAEKEDKAAEKAEEKARLEEEAAAKALMQKKSGNLSKRERNKLQQEADAHSKEAARQRQIAEQSRRAAKNARKRIGDRDGKVKAIQDQLAELDPDGTIQKYLKSNKTKGDFRADIFKEKQELAALQNELDDFYTEVASKARLDAIKNSVTDKEIKSKANEIERLVQEIIAARHLLASSDGKDIDNEIVSLDDMETGAMISNRLINNINKDFIAHSNLSSMDLIRDAGLGVFDTTEGRGDIEKQVNPHIQGLMKQLNLAVSQQKYNYRVRGISEAEEINKAMGRSKDAFDARSKSMAMTQIRQNGRKFAKRSEQ